MKALIQIHISISLILKIMDFPSFLHGSTHFLPFISKILKIMINNQKLRYFGKNNDANPYFQRFSSKNHGFSRFFAEFQTLFIILEKYLSKAIISHINLCLFVEKYDGNAYCREFITKNHGFSRFLVEVHTLFTIY